MKNRFVRLIEAVPWRSKWRQISYAGLVGAGAVLIGALGLREVLPAQAASVVTATPTAPTTTTITQSGTGNALSTGAGAAIGTQYNNIGPCSGAGGNSKPDCSHHYTVIHDNEDAGTLMPAHDVQPNSDSCGPTSGREFTVYFGSGVFVPTTFPATLFNVSSRRVFYLDKIATGKIGINLEIWGDDGRILAVINDGKWHINNNAVFYKDTPDHSTLIVYDQQNKRDINIRFNNPKFVTVSGNIQYLNNSVSISDDGTIMIAGNNLSGMCATGANAIKIGQ